jgi:hypothetical protein
MADVTVNSWSELQDELFRGSWNQGIGRYRSAFVFRGLSDTTYPLDTSLMRLGGPYRELEKHLLRNFRKYAQSMAGELGSFWRLLTVAQHYGLPTRLMDWTYSPYVALHFATENLDHFDVDGVIWVVNFHAVHTCLPTELRLLLSSEGAQAFTVELLASLRLSAECAGSDTRSFHEFVESLTEFDRLGADEEFLLFFEPPSIDDRIINQFALFSVMPNPCRRIDHWLHDHPEFFRRIIIPAELKWECRDKLDQCNITERLLLPGLGGLCTWLKRHYSLGPQVDPQAYSQG